MEKTFCDICKKDITDTYAASVYVHDDPTDKELLNYDVCLKCRNRVLGAIRGLAKP